jgi:hypothetical protein
MYSIYVANGGGAWDHTDIIRAIEIMAQHEIA